MARSISRTNASTSSVYSLRFIQNSLACQRTYVWGSPHVPRNGRGNAQGGETVVVPATVQVETNQNLQPRLLDTVRGAVPPLYASGPIALRPPGYGSAHPVAAASDTPFQRLRRVPLLAQTNAGNQVTVEYGRLVGASISDNFRVWLVVYHVDADGTVPPNGDYSALRVGGWRIRAGDGTLAAQNQNNGRAMIDPIGPANPNDLPVIAPPVANDVINNPQNYTATGSANTVTIRVPF